MKPNSDANFRIFKESVKKDWNEQYGMRKVLSFVFRFHLVYKNEFDSSFSFWKNDLKLQKGILDLRKNVVLSIFTLNKSLI
jgi:hypothetical protein